jgi:limonene-1,2-epoxide hydrolase
MKILSVTLAAVLTASSATAADPLGTVRAYIDAHNRHDIDAVLDLLDPEIAYVMPSGETRNGLEQMANLEAWDSVLESFLEVADLRVSGNSVVAGEIVEHNLLFDLSGIGPITYLPGTAYEVTDDRITTIRASAWKSDQVAVFTDFMNRFLPWADATYPGAVRDVMRDGEFRYDEVSAQTWLQLLVAWKDHLKPGVTN